MSLDKQTLPEVACQKALGCSCRGCVAERKANRPEGQRPIPTTRTQEVSRSAEDIVEALQRTTDFIKSHGAELEYMDLHTILARLDFVERAATQGASLLKAHDVMKERLGNIFGPSLSLNEIMDKLEAHPKPQSDEGLRAALEAGKRCADYACRNTFGHQMDLDAIEDALAALSRQAPVPTPSDEEAAKAIWHDSRIGFVEDGKSYQRTVAFLAEHLSRHRQGSAPGPTSGAVEEWRDRIASALSILQTYNALGIPVDVVVDLKLAENELHEALATQPPAADGKLREALELLLPWVRNAKKFFSREDLVEADIQKAMAALNDKGVV